MLHAALVPLAYTAFLPTSISQVDTFVIAATALQAASGAQTCIEEQYCSFTPRLVRNSLEQRQQQYCSSIGCVARAAPCSSYVAFTLVRIATGEVVGCWACDGLWSRGGQDFWGASRMEQVVCAVGIGPDSPSCRPPFDTKAGLLVATTCSQGTASAGSIWHAGCSPAARSKQRYAPYSFPARHKPLQQQQAQACTTAATTSTTTLSGCPEGGCGAAGAGDVRAAEGPRSGMLQMAITLANSALESTLLYFNQACTAAAGSAQALAALDAAEAAMAQTTRMTSIASVLAKRAMQQEEQQEQGCASPCLQLQLQQAERLQVALCASLDDQQQQQQVGLAGFVQAMLPPTEEEVEAGEEVSSSCACSGNAVDF